MATTRTKGQRFFETKHTSSLCKTTQPTKKKKYFILVPVPQKTLESIVSTRKDQLESLQLHPETTLGKRLEKTFKTAQQKSVLEGKKLRKTLTKSLEDINGTAKSLLKRLQKQADKRDVYDQIVYFEPNSDESDLSRMKIATQDVLYIVAHGGNGLIGMHDELLNLTPRDLAYQILEMGVPIHLTTLKIMACNSGLYEKSTKDADQTRCFVSELCRELYRLGYRQLTIHGYVGYTQETLLDKHSLCSPALENPQLKIFTPQFRASDCRVTVRGGDGAIVTTLKKTFIVETDWCQEWIQTPLEADQPTAP